MEKEKIKLWKIIVAILVILLVIFAINTIRKVIIFNIPEIKRLPFQIEQGNV